MLKTLLLLTTLAVPFCDAKSLTPPWSVDASTGQWISSGNFTVGANFIPSNAVNELEMWQAETFDIDTIDRELGYAQSLGFNAMRVFLHNLLWDGDNNTSSETLLSNMDTFLSIANERGIGIMFVLLDSCWNAEATLGPQPDPTPYVHNSQWVQAPGSEMIHDPVAFTSLKSYVTGVIRHFQNDSRIIAWDLWNEPDNSGYTSDLITPLITRVFAWAREAQPTQPLTTPLWQHIPWGSLDTLTQLEQVQVEFSDVISFHAYTDVDQLEEIIQNLKVYGKPLVCTEYMAREAGSYFDPNLGFMKSAGVDAFNWGLVSGKTQTIYPWASLNTPNPYEGVDDPDPWFHDIFTSDGSPKYPEEADYIRSVTLGTTKDSLKHDCCSRHDNHHHHDDHHHHVDHHHNNNQDMQEHHDAHGGMMHHHHHDDHHHHDHENGDMVPYRNRPGI